MSRIAIVGGTGPEGRGLGLRFGIAGHDILLGSRDAARAQEAADGLSATQPELSIAGVINEVAVDGADVVLLSVPFEGLRPTATQLCDRLAGKLVISIVAPLAFVDGQMKALTVEEGSAGELTRDLLPQCRVASAFQNLSARDLLRPDQALIGDVAICSDDSSARSDAMHLASDLPGLRPVDAGPMSNSRYIEELTALLININKIHKAHSTIQFLGI